MRTRLDSAVSSPRIRRPRLRPAVRPGRTSGTRTRQLQRAGRSPQRTGGLDWARRVELISVLLSSFAAVAALWYSNGQAQQANTQARQERALTKEGQITDRYNAAVENLGNDKADVRLGGIYALQRIMQDSRRDHPTIANVLAAYVRTHAITPSGGNRGVPADVQAALTVLATQTTSHGGNVVLDLRRVWLPKAELGFASPGERKKVSLAHSDLEGAHFVEANLGSADLRGADLHGADLRNVNLMETDLGGADLRRTDLRGAALADAYLTGAYLTGLDLTHTHLMRAHLDDALLSGADLRGAELHHTEMARATLVRADLRGADLRGADLLRAALNGAHLNGASLNGANLSGADLTGADLSGADLSGIVLRGARLTGADLHSVDLRGADLAHTDLARSQLSSARIDAATNLPFKLYGKARHLPMSR